MYAAVTRLVALVWRGKRMLNLYITAHRVITSSNEARSVPTPSPSPNHRDQGLFFVDTDFLDLLLWTLSLDSCGLASFAPCMLLSCQPFP